MNTLKPTEGDNAHSGLLKAPLNNCTKRIFIAATCMNAGKTTTSLALFSALRARTSEVGFIKPVGQRYVEVSGKQIDEDSVLLDAIFDVKVPIEAMSPISIHPNFTRQFLDDPKNKLKVHIDHMCRAFDRAAYEKDYVIIEGTGHAGVGSVFDLSNAQVARRLNAKVIIVANGGIGRPIDEIAMNKALFENAGVEVIGVIINKIIPKKFEFIKKYCDLALKRMGIPLLGCIPIEEKLTVPSLKQVANELQAGWINTQTAGESSRYEDVIIGAMTAKKFQALLKPKVLIITTSDREDLILAAIEAEKKAETHLISGFILTEDIKPSTKLLKAIAQTNIPVMLCSQGSYNVASKIKNMTVKTLPTDADKIPIIKDLITQSVDLDAICNAFGAQTMPLPELEL